MLVIDNDRFTHVHTGRFKKRPICTRNVLDRIMLKVPLI